MGEAVRASVGLGVDCLGFEWLMVRVRRLGFDGCLGFQIGLGLLG